MNLKLIKNNKNLMFYLLIISIPLLYILLSSSFKNIYTYPDSYLYLKYSLNTIINPNIVMGDNSYKVDYLVTIKPLSALFVQFIGFLNIFPGVINGVLITASGLLIFKSTNKKLSFLTFITLLIFTFNGNFIYWFNKYSAEFFGIFLVSLLIFGIKKDARFLTYTSAVMLLLTRPEFILILPTLGLINRRNLKPFIKISITFILFFGIVATIQNNAASYLKNIVISSILVNIFVYTLYSQGKILSKFNRIINLVIKLGILPILILYFIGLTNGNYFSSFTGLISATILMFGLFGLFALYFEPARENLIFLFCIFTLGSTYILTATDGFRYFILIAPLILYIILKSINNSSIVYKIVFIAFFVIQSLFTYFSIPYSILINNYWHQRFDSIEGSTILKDYKIVSSTPLISSYLGLNSDDICNYNYIPRETVFLLDGYAESRCIENVVELKTQLQLFDKMYETQDIVNISKYSSVGDVTRFYVNH